MRRLRFSVVVVAFLASCGGGQDALPREIVDCSDDDAVCDRYPDTGCSVDLVIIDADGQVVGICGDGDERRVCSKHCEQDGDCQDGWTCLLPEHCPGDNTVHFCVPTPTELQLQQITECRANANPRVCGFF